MNSLRTKFIMLAIALVMITQSTTLVTIFLTAEDSIAEQAETQLDLAGTAFNAVLRERENTLRHAALTAASSIALHPGEIERAGDIAIDSLAHAVREGGATFGMLLDQGGRIIASTSALSPDAQAQRQLALLPGDTRHRRAIIEFDNHWFDVVTVAVSADERSGFITLAGAIDRSLVRDLRRQLNTDLTIYRDGVSGTRVLASSIDRQAPMSGSAEFAFDPYGRIKSRQFEIDGKRYAGQVIPFAGATNSTRVLLLAPIDTAIAPFKTLQMVTIAAGLLALLIGIFSSTLLYRAVLRQIERFAAAARRIGSGDYGQSLTTRHSEDMEELATAMNSMQSNIVQREEKVTNQAEFDRRTNLPNRFLIIKQLQEMIDRLKGADVMISVMLVDLNSFSEVSMSFGRDVGDALLTRAAERLRASVDQQHMLAHLEGDEFLVLMEGVEPTTARQTADDIRHAFEARLPIHDVNISIDAGIGICAYPQDGETPDELLQHATIARNDARETPDNIMVYKAGKGERYTRQLVLLGDLRRAVSENELKLYMQPKVRLADGSVCGAEALARWDHPTLGFLPPRDFIAIAERSGNIPLITQWALTTAVRRCRQWLDEGLDLPVSVNLTGEDLRDPKLPCFIVETLRDHDLDAKYLTLEISEQSLSDDLDRMTVVLQCLSELGTGIAIDDFGTGKCSLAQIKNLPVDELKIDRTFIREVPDNRKDVAVVSAMIDLAHNLGMRVLAEGVESRPAMSWLAAQRCEQAQGYFISRPMPAETFAQWHSHFNGDVTAYVSVMDAIGN